jgi:benzoyl-CoA reductase/2-hydroxyglutaryl-CoA dehydratase subunit BcrC/BadD/HgdB
MNLVPVRLRSAIALTNHRRNLQRQLLERRWAGAVTGVEALQAIGAGYFMAPESYAEALGAYVAELRPDSRLDDRPRLLVVTSEPLAHTALHQALETAGAIVVAEDDWWGSRSPGEDVPLAGSALEAIFRKYWLDTASSAVYPAEAREAWLKQQALRPDLDGIVFYVPPSDHQFGWDYPRLRLWLEHHHVRSLLLRWDATQPDGAAAISAATTRFLAERQP